MLRLGCLFLLVGGEFDVFVGVLATKIYYRGKCVKKAGYR